MSGKKIIKGLEQAADYLAEQKDTADRLEEMNFQVERQHRHYQAIFRSDIQELRNGLKSAADRFDDVATLLEKDSTYDAISFLRASAKRYRRLADVTPGSREGVALAAKAPAV